MKFLVDAQLPYGLSLFLKQSGYDTIHTDDLPDKERTKDNIICIIADKDDRVVISKDSDFFSSCILRNTPKKLLWISTGNLRNREFFALFKANYKQLISLLEENSLIEMDNTDIIIHY